MATATNYNNLRGVALAAAFEEIRAAVGKPCTCSHNGNGTYTVFPRGSTTPNTRSAAEIRLNLTAYRERLTNEAA
jgi:hypothetical protein